MNKVFYDKINNKEIFDISGTMTAQEAAQKFNLQDVQEIELSLDELQQIDSEGKLSKIKKSDLNNEFEQNKAELRMASKEKLESILNKTISDEDFEIIIAGIK